MYLRIPRSGPLQSNHIVLLLLTLPIVVSPFKDLVTLHRKRLPTCFGRSAMAMVTVDPESTK